MVALLEYNPSVEKMLNAVSRFQEQGGATLEINDQSPHLLTNKQSSNHTTHLELLLVFFIPLLPISLIDLALVINTAMDNDTFERLSAMDFSENSDGSGLFDAFRKAFSGKMTDPDVQLISALKTQYPELIVT